MKLKRLAFGGAILLLFGCTEKTAVAPELELELDPLYCTTPFLEGRMTGGGVVRMQDVAGDVVKITHGFTLHCDITLSNNLEVNWAGNQWHLEKESLSSVVCSDDPAVDPEPPAAPFDTFCASAWGRLNGVWGSRIDFCLQDAGEPGGKNDKAGMTITDPGGGVVLDVPFDMTMTGNLQAHYDQPHK